MSRLQSGQIPNPLNSISRSLVDMTHITNSSPPQKKKVTRDKKRIKQLTGPYIYNGNKSSTEHPYVVKATKVRCQTNVTKLLL